MSSRVEDKEPLAVSGARASRARSRSLVTQVVATSFLFILASILGAALALAPAAPDGAPPSEGR